ncbi:MAG TPA: hypothetical protein VK633_04165 [Verrucomicrobiae bacterium]|nr:hypothetical protein [Verrucomicrobiae bacterium]
MIDSQILPKAQNDSVKKHLTDTRQHVAQHLALAQRLQGGSSVGTPGAGVNTGAGAAAPKSSRSNPPGQ